MKEHRNQFSEVYHEKIVQLARRMRIARRHRARMHVRFVPGGRGGAGSHRKAG